MFDTIQKLKYRANAGIAQAQAELANRLNDRVALPLPGLHGETLYLTGYTALQKKAAELDAMYEKLPVHRSVRDTILMDAWSSATIEGAQTSVEKVRQNYNNPKTKDERMVINTIAGSNYAYGRPITSRNIRKLWDKIVDGVCENADHQGKKYRDGMVYIGSADRIIHVPARAEILPELMDKWFEYREAESKDILIRSFAAHFYFVYIHPFCDGNGRAARILNASHLYHSGYKKMKSLPLASAINNELSGYYSSLSDSEVVLNGMEAGWLDVSPFVSYMLDAFERCLIDAALSRNTLSEAEKRLLERMNRVGIHAQITAKKAAGILNKSENAARTVLNKLVQKGYLTVDTSGIPFVYRLEQHIPD